MDSHDQQHQKITLMGDRRRRRRRPRGATTGLVACSTCSKIRPSLRLLLVALVFLSISLGFVLPATGAFVLVPQQQHQHQHQEHHYLQKRYDLWIPTSTSLTPPRFLFPYSTIHATHHSNSLEGDDDDESFSSSSSSSSSSESISSYATTTSSSSSSCPTGSTITRDDDDIPRHVAFICDGNSRWAKQNNCSTSQGHWMGADRLVDLLEYLREDGIAYCTLYGFSTENWKRPRHEIQEIFRVMEQTARNLVPRLLQKSSSSSSLMIQLRILGDLEDDRIPLGLRTILQQLQKLTDQQSQTRQQQQQEQHQQDQHIRTTSNNENSSSSSNSNNNRLTVCLAINYGGRQDILQASQKMAAAVVAGELSAEEMTEETLASYLSTAGIPDPDLIVRTSGEHRLSNFLLWNAAYSELYITNVLWPDFDAHCWHEALSWYQQRKRRFGSRKAVDTTTGTTGTGTAKENNSELRTRGMEVNNGQHIRPE